MDDPVYGPGRLRVNIPVNGGEGRIQGFEASFGSFFDFLPGWLSGFATDFKRRNSPPDSRSPPRRLTVLCL